MRGSLPAVVRCGTQRSLALAGVALWFSANACGGDGVSISGGAETDASTSGDPGTVGSLSHSSTTGPSSSEGDTTTTSGGPSGTVGPDDTGDTGETGATGSTGADQTSRWVAVGPDLVGYSLDGGRTWVEAEAGATGSFADVTSDGEGTWVAVGGSNINTFTVDLARSIDGGRTWQALEPNVAHPLRAVTHAEGRWSAMGFNDNDGRISAIGASGAAESWTDASFDAPNGASIMSMAYGDGMWVAVGFGVVVSSNDGIDWTQSAEQRPLFGVAHADGQWVAVGPPGTIAVTTDPSAAWTVVDPHPVNVRLGGIAYGGGRWVAVGHDGTIMWATDPTGPWTIADTDTQLDLNGVVYDPFTETWGVVGGWPGGGGPALVLYSDDAQIWMPATLWDDELTGEFAALAVEFP